MPSTCVDVYKDDKFWGSFATIVPIGAVGNKCATPTIKIESGILKFNCATDGVEYHYTVTAPERYSATGNNVQLPLTYTISVYATKSGWEASDVKQQEFYVTGGIRGDLNNDGFVNVADHVELSNIIFEQDK